MKRQHQFLLIASTLGFSWLAMQVVHELGHVAAARATGGRIAEVRLHPAEISFTMLAENPQPLVVTGMGPLVGVALPLAAWWIARFRRLPGWYVFQFFAGFCLAANGAYLAGGAIYNVGDASDLVRQGVSPPLICLIGLPAVLSGCWLWNGLGSHFGLGETKGRVDCNVAYVVTLLLFAIIALELAFA
ncbi:MAG: hypothetical protein WD669_04040 [Pirellulales bacterium]